MTGVGGPDDTTRPGSKDSQPQTSKEAERGMYFSSGHFVTLSMWYCNFQMLPCIGEETLLVWLTQITIWIIYWNSAKPNHLPWTIVCEQNVEATDRDVMAAMLPQENDKTKATNSILFPLSLGLLKPFYLHFRTMEIQIHIHIHIKCISLCFSVFFTRWTNGSHMRANIWQAQAKPLQPVERREREEIRTRDLPTNYSTVQGNNNNYKRLKFDFDYISITTMPS